MTEKKESKTRRAPSIENRRARHEYTVVDSFEAGIALMGSEVKSIRDGKASLAEAYAMIFKGEVMLCGMHIATYKQASYTGHIEKRDRKLLLHRKEIDKLSGKLNEKGLTLIPLKMYFKGRKLKVELGLCKGKQLHDKREAIRERDRKRSEE